MDYNQLYGEFSNEFWSHFESSELAQGRKSATFQLWLKRSKVARRSMKDFLSEHGAPKDNPYYWLQHFPEPVPRDYNGSAELNRMAATSEMVVALYGGKAGIYTRQEAEEYEMEIKRVFSL